MGGLWRQGPFCCGDFTKIAGNGPETALFIFFSLYFLPYTDIIKQYGRRVLGLRMKKSGMVLRMRYKRGLAWVLVLALLAGILAGCAEEEEEWESEVSYPDLVNDGAQTELVMAYTDTGDAYLEVLGEIIEKYRADFPGTAITLTPCGSEEEAYALLRSGEADLVQVDGARQAALVQEGALWNFCPYLRSWREEPGLNNIARQAVYSMGDRNAYLLPADFQQEVLFYRADWLEDYNDAQEDEEDYLWCRTWGQIHTVHETLGDKGRLALAGKNRLGFYFDTILWSRAGRGVMKSPAASYYALPTDEIKDDDATLFPTEAAEQAAARFFMVMTEDIVPGCYDWDIDQAVDAFVSGEAGMLLADSSYYQALREALPKGALGVEGMTRTDNNRCVAYTPFWGWGISAESGSKETAIHFLTYLSNADNSTHMAKVAGTLPLHNEGLMMEPSLKEGDRGTEIRMCQLGNEYMYANRPDMFLAASEEFPALYEGWLKAYIEGDSSAEELLDELDAFWKEAYPEGPHDWEPVKEEDEDEESGVLAASSRLR